jgi:ADP-dependent NAD(P)H-hydrate dehydratase
MTTFNAPACQRPNTQEITMTSTTNLDRARAITPQLLREWPLPTAEGSKYSRGQIVVIGGAKRCPGAALLAGEAALRVGTGRLTLAVADSVAGQLAIAVPEAGVVYLDETSDGHILGNSVRRAEADLADADAVLVGPGLDDADEAVAMLSALPSLLSDQAVVLLDAFALGVLPQVAEVVDALRGRLILTPNQGEVERLLGESVDDLLAALPKLAKSYGAVISCQNFVASPAGDVWSSGTGTVGLATSGSGDALAGAIAGLAARGAGPDQAGVWGTYLHATAGDILATRFGPVGFLAHELLLELPAILNRVRPE